MRGAEGQRKRKAPAAEGIDPAGFIPEPKERRDEKGEIIPFISPVRREMLRQEVQKRIDNGMDFYSAFDEAFNRSTFWKHNLDPELLGAYATVIFDSYGKEYRPQDDWFHKDIAPRVAEERAAMDSEFNSPSER